MTLSDSLRMIVAALEDAGVPFMIAGSVASGYHGETRSTQDVDMVIDPSSEALDRFVSGLDPSRFYVGDHRRALAQRDMFNVIDMANGWKFDLIVRHDRPFSVEEFARRRPGTIEDVAVHFATAEDVVLSKLEWGKASDSTRQFDDARAVVRSAGLDRAYLELWADRLDIREELASLLDENQE